MVMACGVHDILGKFLYFRGRVFLVVVLIRKLLIFLFLLEGGSVAISNFGVGLDCYISFFSSEYFSVSLNKECIYLIRKTTRLHSVF